MRSSGGGLWGMKWKKLKAESSRQKRRMTPHFSSCTAFVRYCNNRVHRMRAFTCQLCYCALIAAFYRADAASFSDANYVSLGTMPGADGTVYAVIKEPISGALYIGGGFR